MASAAIVAGLGIAALGFGARFVLRTIPQASQRLAKAAEAIAEGDLLKSNKYYKGGFDPKMTKREAALILGVNSNSAAPKVKVAYKNLMRINHPDRGGSPYISSKITEAREILEK